MQYKMRNDQLNQLDGDIARMDIGREELKVFMKGAEDVPAIAKKSPKGFGYATDLHVQNFLDCVRTRKTPTAPMRARLPGGAGGADGEYVIEAGPSVQMERRAGEGGRLTDYLARRGPAGSISVGSPPDSTG